MAGARRRLTDPEGNDEYREHGVAGGYLPVRWASAAFDAHLVGRDSSWHGNTSPNRARICPACQPDCLARAPAIEAGTFFVFGWPMLNRTFVGYASGGALRACDRIGSL